MTSPLPPLFYLCLAGASVGGMVALALGARLLRGLRRPRRLREVLRCEGATAAVEFILVIILLLQITLLTWQLGVLASAYMIVDGAAFHAARSAIVTIPEATTTVSGRRVKVDEQPNELRATDSASLAPPTGPSRAAPRRSGKLLDIHESAAFGCLEIVGPAAPRTFRDGGRIRQILEELIFPGPASIEIVQSIVVGEQPRTAVDDAVAAELERAKRLVDEIRLQQRSLSIAAARAAGRSFSGEDWPAVDVDAFPEGDVERHQAELVSLVSRLRRFTPPMTDDRAASLLHKEDYVPRMLRVMSRLTDLRNAFQVESRSRAVEPRSLPDLSGLAEVEVLREHAERIAEREAAAPQSLDRRFRAAQLLTRTRVEPEPDPTRRTAPRLPRRFPPANLVEVRVTHDFVLRVPFANVILSGFRTVAGVGHVFPLQGRAALPAEGFPEIRPAGAPADVDPFALPRPILRIRRP